MKIQEFVDGLEIIERAMQRQLSREFWERTLWPYFKDEKAETWARVCQKISEDRHSVSTLTLKDFIAAKVNIDTARRAENQTPASERMEKRRKDLAASQEEWDSLPSTEEIAQKIYEETGSEYHKEWAEQLRHERLRKAGQ